MMRAISVALCAALYGGAALADNSAAPPPPPPFKSADSAVQKPAKSAVHKASSNLSEAARKELKSLLPADLEDFTVHETPYPMPDTKFFDPDGKKIDLSAFAGKVTLVNFWATWCPPCLKELPSLNALHKSIEDKGGQVIVISLDRAPRGKIVNFLAKRELDNLAAYTAPRSKIAMKMSVLGLPVTAILGPDGAEIGRKRGDAEWNAEEIVEIVELIARETQETRREPHSFSRLRNPRLLKACTMGVRLYCARPTQAEKLRG